MMIRDIATWLGAAPIPDPGPTIWYGEDMLETVVIPVDDIYVPVKRRKDLEAARVEALAESILEEGQRTPIQVRPRCAPTRSATS